MRNKTLELFEEYYNNINNSLFERSLTAIYLFDFLDRLRIDHFPTNWFDRLQSELHNLSNYNQFLSSSFDFSLNNFEEWKASTIEDVESKTGEVYFNLWKDFKKEEYFQQTATYLKERFAKNDIRFENVEHLLDDGCGGGRYTLALKSLGAQKVTGIDISHNSIDFAQKMNPFKEEEASFQQGSVLELPFEDNTFDFVFSNGVLHHTLSTEKGLQEIRRVLKPEGKCWLYLYGGKESLFWDIVDFARKLLSDIPQSYVQHLMKVMGYPSGRIFHRNDFFYVPIHHRYLEKEVDKMLQTTGFSEFRRLKRGIGYDWDEMIFNNPHIDPYIYGEGEMRYWIEK